MTAKKLSPERIAAIDSAVLEYGRLSEAAYREIRAHIEALEVDVTVECNKRQTAERRAWQSREKEEEHKRAKERLTKELAESKAECERLRARVEELAQEIRIDDPCGCE